MLEHLKTIAFFLWLGLPLLATAKIALDILTQ